MYFDQTVDHFANNSSNVFLQRYFLDTTYVSIESKSIIVYLPGSLSLENCAILPSAIIEAAKENKAMILALELRGFGRSVFFETSGLDELRYISFDQMLMDISCIVNSYSTSCWGAKCSVMIAGDGIGGVLAAVFRSRFPHIVNGAWSSFSPLYFDLETAEFDNQIIKRIKSVSEECLSATKRILYTVEKIFTTGTPSTQNQLKELFGISVSTKPSVAMFLISNIFSYFDSVYPSVMNVFQEYCDTVGSPGDIHLFAQYFYLILSRNSVTVNDIDPTFLSNISASFQNKDERLRWYLKCFQIGMFPVSSSMRPRSLNLHFFQEICYDLFSSDGFDEIPMIRNNFIGTSFSGSSVTFTSNTDSLLSKSMVSNESQYYDISVITIPGVYGPEDMFCSKENCKKVKDTFIEKSIEWLNDTCNYRCQHGYCILNTCKCFTGWSGPSCSNRMVSKGFFKTVITTILIIPSIILCIFIRFLWVLVFSRKRDRTIIE